LDFSKVNIPKILEGAMPVRFQDLSPSDFEDFIAQLFKANGYEVKQTTYSGDYGADLLLTVAEEKIAVQIKRYSKDTKVGVKDINQIVGAKDYYRCDKARIITTSSFTKPGEKLALRTRTDLWDWDKLQRYICETFLDGKDYYHYFEGNQDAVSTSRQFDFKVTKVQYTTQMEKIGSCTLIHANMKNLTNKNISVTLYFPIYISKDNKQIEAAYWYLGYFTSGTVYAGCEVEVAFMFRTEQLPVADSGGKIVFRWLDDEANEISQKCKIGNDTRDKVPTIQTPPLKEYKMIPPSRSTTCYIVTMCYGIGSGEYIEMTYFRDNFLLRFHMGIFVVKSYYRYGKYFVETLSKYISVKMASRFILKMILVPVIIYNRRKRKKLISKCTG